MDISVYQKACTIADVVSSLPVTHTSGADRRALVSHVQAMKAGVDVGYNMNLSVDKLLKAIFHAKVIMSTTQVNHGQ